MRLIVRMQGGLGNQLFQVAFAHHVARRTGRRVIMDVSCLERTTVNQPRSLEVSSKHSEIPFVALRPVRFRPADRLVKRLQVVERDPTDQVLTRVRPYTTQVIGYFQTAATVEAEAGRMTRVVRAHLPTVASVEPFVAVHVRLGDFLAVRSTREFHQACDPSWLLERGRQLLGEVGASQLRVFTDDVTNFERLTGGTPRDVVVDDSTSSWVAISRMSHAEALVMSNSTMSWWAAFTARHVHGRDIPVVCPTPWFAKASVFDERIALAGWTRELRQVLDED